MANSVAFQIGERIQRFRIAASIDAQEAANASGLSLEDYEAGEAGVRSFSAEELVEIANIVGICMADIFSNLKP